MMKKVKIKELHTIAKISNSQNGVVYLDSGISPCLCSGGNGHDAFVPYIIEVYYERQKDSTEG